MVENTEQPSAIADIIDWQFMMVAPLFTQARFADFLKYMAGKKIAMEAGIFLPKRPENYGLMSVTDQKVVDAELREASTHKLYEIFLEKRNTMHYVSQVYEFTGHNVMSLLSASRTWHEGLHYLREVMYQIVLVWPKIASGAALPHCVDVASLERDHLAFQHLEEYERNVARLSDRLQLRSDGWVANERYDEVMKLNEEKWEKWDSRQMGGPYTFQDGAPSWAVEGVELL